jgi:hypothetical protein
MEPIEPLLTSYHLWDGGVYDNLGVEALYKPNGGLRDGVDFLVVSDASKPINLASRSWKDFLRGRRFLRLVLRFTNSVLVLGFDLLLKWEAC